MPNPRKPPGNKRETLFRLIALSLPFVFLLLVELALRWADYGYNLRLFVDDPQRPGYLIMNPDASKKYFITQENATIGNQEPFLKEKPPGTVRIFVLGESTTVGYPYLHNGSFHRWLQYRLLHSVPDTQFEIINLSLTAVNSYTVRGFAEEITDYQPDAVLIYTGHNEYYGAMGVGSTSQLGGNVGLVRVLLGLRHSRLVQGIYRAVAWVRSSGAKVDVRENLMKRMAAEQQIPYASEIYAQGIAQFEQNMDATLRQLDGLGIPVFVGTLVSNEKDLKPFISAMEPAEASAQAQFEQGQKALATGDTARARSLFIKAKELDMLRFRAPERMNGIISELSAKYPNVHRVAVREMFLNNSKAGIVGAETMLEHVHPNLYGYALMSDAFYEKMKETGFLQVPAAGEMPFAQLLTQMPVTRLDSLKGVYEVEVLKSGWPFNEPLPPAPQREKTLEEQLAGALVVRQMAWDVAMTQLLAFYQNQQDPAKTLRVAEALALEHATSPAYFRQAGKLALAARAPQKAQTYLARSFALAPDAEVARDLAISYLKSDQPAQARPYVQHAAASSEPMRQLLPLVEGVIAARQSLAGDSGSVAAYQRVAQAYLAFANAEAAMGYVEKAEKLDAGNAETARLRRQAEGMLRK